MKALAAVVLLQAFAVFVHATVWVKEMENAELFEGDIVLQPEELVNGSISYASMRGGRWPHGVIPYEIDYSLQSEPKAIDAIMQAIGDYHKYTCIRWKPKGFEKEHVLFFRGSGCSSPVGHHKNSVNRISLAHGCWHKGSTMHEMGHTAGFWHEQSRPDRDKFVKIRWENIMEGMEYNFEKRTKKDVDSLGTPYDLRSMMHYGTALFTKNGKRTIQVLDYSKRMLIGQRLGFSNIDIIQLNLMYKCPPYKGTLPPKICKDESNRCAHYKRYGYCTKPAAEASMYQLCCKTCFGDASGSHTYPPTKQPTTKPVHPTKAGGCVDKLDKKTCTYWASLGKCESGEQAMRDFMKKNCCKTCRDHHG